MMISKSDYPKCFGTQGMVTLAGEAGTPCLDCKVFDTCHKLSVAGCLHAICSDINLIVENGLVGGSILDYEELDAMAKKAARRKKRS